MINTMKFNIKKLLIITLLSLSIFTLASCDEERVEINNVIAIGYIGDDIYLINSDNNSLLLEGYDLIQEAIDDYMFFRKDGKYGFINILGKEIIEPIYDKAYAMKENKAVVVKDGIHYIINELGEVIYQLPTNVTSSSYFSLGRLVIKRDDKYGFLSYNEETKKFTLPGEFIYDYALPFSEGYSVVGIESDMEVEAGAPSQKNVKYNYLGLNGILLFEDYIYDEADSFSGGVAKVGTFKKDVKVEAIGTGNYNTAPKYYDLMVYNYIYPSGQFVIDQSTLLPLECHYGSTPSDGVISTALMKHYVNDTIEVNLFKQYTFYNVYGEKVYDSCFQYTSINNVNVFWPTNLLQLGPNHVFAYGKQSISWSFAIAIEEELQFKPLYLEIDSSLPWIEELANSYYTNTLYIENVLRYPYHVGDIKHPTHSTDTRPIVVAQLNFDDNGKYGIIQFNYDSAVYEQTHNFEGAYSIYYIVAPIYDRIII